MKRLTAIAVVAWLAIGASPVLAWDPDWEALEPDPPAPAAWSPDPSPVAPPDGVYLVTETYAGDSVVQSGPVTTYTTETVHETTGSYARVLESVGTGGSSAYDGSAFNGRAALTDGRAVAGTYYENYIRTDRGFVPVSVVFFQDDAEVARAAAPSAPTPTPPAAPAVVAPVTLILPVTPGAAAPVAPAKGAVTPVADPPPSRSVPAPASTLLADRAVEVLRGRRIAIALAGSDVRAWRYVSGDAVALGALSGRASDPFVARWDSLAPAGTAWVLRFAVDYADGTTHDLSVRVTVRAPGLVE
ncbi:MAG TPA: hypothetical protein VKR80_01495 [Candidatus Limnocylindria bacterium]|nr:hypothetical protein [Candidatus Limnocylindria bacterium]